MSEKICLQWNDFQENVKSAFGNMREDEDFTDVTLVCEDGQQVEAHKVILAASSSFFQRLLGRNKHHPHPLIYMRGVKYVDMLAFIDFLYCGEANVYQDNLEAFLEIAKELQLKGLVEKTREKLEDIVDDKTSVGKMMGLINKDNVRTSKPSSSDTKQIPKSNFLEVGRDKTAAVRKNISVNLDDLEETVRSMMEKRRNKLANGVQKADVCKICGKEGKSNVIKAHIEANHLGEMTFPCNLCEKTSRTRQALKMHKFAYHK